MRSQETSTTSGLRPTGAINPVTRRTLRSHGDLNTVRIDSAEPRLGPSHSSDLGRIDAPTTSPSPEAELLRLFTESVPNHTIVMLDPAGNIVRWNLGAERICGYAADDILGLDYAHLFPVDDEDAPLRREILATAEREGRVELESMLIRRDGSSFPARLKIVPLGDAASLTGFALLINDVTERNRTEEFLRNRFVESAHLARLSTVGQMVAELAHELNQPLAAAANYARACVNFGRSGQCVVAPEALEWMDRSATQAMRAVKIAKRLGAFVKKDDGRRTFLQVNTMVDQVLLLARSTLQGGDDIFAPIEVETDFHTAGIEIQADPVQVEQVMLNLIRNAVEAMHEVRDRRHLLTLRTTVDDSFVTLSVGDTGPGIAPEKLGGLFDPFFTTKASGLGLGLSISRSIVEQHGGRMTVESSPAGTTFSFTLPLPQGGHASC